jgi:hypothetical protein
VPAPEAGVLGRASPTVPSSISGSYKYDTRTGLRREGVISLQLLRNPKYLSFCFADCRLPTGEGDPLLLPQVIVGQGIRSGASDLLETKGIELQL